MISEIVKNFIDKYRLSQPFIVAFSGGYDSMCLLDVLSKLNCGKIIAVHLNHNWRGEESDNEEDVCRQFASSRGVEFYTERLKSDVAKTETAARDERYKFFSRCAEKFNSKVVFTAHNYNDNAETVLYRIIKGTGTIGLQGISENRDIFYRPLLNVKRKDIEVYCKQEGLAPNRDSSNENIKYRRNFIRKEIIPLMEEINPNVIDALNSLSQIARDDMTGKNDENYFVRNLLVNAGVDYDRKKIEDIKLFINENKNSKSGKVMSLTTGMGLFVNNKTVEVIKNYQKSSESINITDNGEFQFGSRVFSIRPFEKTDDKPIEYPKDCEYRAYISINKIDFTLRYRKDGDFIKPLGAAGHQKLKKYLNEKKIPQHKKDNIVLLCSGQEVLWAAGIGISEKIKVINQPTHVLELREVP